MINYTCPHCNNALQIDDKFANRDGTCKHCGNNIKVPGGFAPTPFTSQSLNVGSEASTEAKVPISLPFLPGHESRLDKSLKICGLIALVNFNILCAAIWFGIFLIILSTIGLIGTIGELDFPTQSEINEATIPIQTSHHFDGTLLHKYIDDWNDSESDMMVEAACEYLNGSKWHDQLHTAIEVEIAHNKARTIVVGMMMFIADNPNTLLSVKDAMKRTEQLLDEKGRYSAID